MKAEVYNDEFSFSIPQSESSDDISIPEIKKTPRNIVSYFEHERKALIDFPSDLEEVLSSGFNNIVFCISEETLISPKTLRTVKDSIRQTKDEKLMVLANPWSIGKVFGGEGVSPFVQTGETPCFCNEQFDSLLTRWVETVHDAGVDGIFWDEPETKCKDHNEIELITRYSEISSDLGMYNSICLPSSPENYLVLEEFARLETIDDISTDPYWPNAFTKIPKEERQTYITKWARRVHSLSQEYGVDGHLWLQGFDISIDDIGMIQEFSSIMEQESINDLAFWGFKGCESLFDTPTNSTKASAPEIWKAAQEVFNRRKNRKEFSIVSFPTQH